MLNQGGFECYISADIEDAEEEGLQAAEVYKGPDLTADEDEDESQLLSVSAGGNVLSLVMRDENIMRSSKCIRLPIS